MPVFAFIVTIAMGIFVDGFIGIPMNWPNAGTVVAVATMGLFVLWAVRHPKSGEEAAPQEPGEEFRERSAE